MASAASCVDFCAACAERFQFASFAAAVKNQETEALGLQELAFAGPGVDFLSGRRADPVAGVDERLAEDGEGVVAGIDIAVETEIGGCDRIGCWATAWCVVVASEAGREETQEAIRNGRTAMAPAQVVRDEMK